jgi:hypothetical protein
MNRLLLLCLIVLCLHSPSAISQQFSEAIEDNSFWIEEAYNQDARVVQHISTGFYQRDSKNFLFTFTQEYPLGGQTHQLSYTIPYQSLHAGSQGIGDILINYRYQWWDGHDWCWIAPRFSLILPTGNSSSGLGSGVVGFQACLPASKRWSDQWVTHGNVGVTLLPNVEGTASSEKSVHHTLPSFFIGGSCIWLLNKIFNLMCEVLDSYNSAIDASGSVHYENQMIISPGVRFAINVGTLQIVPGAALPVTVTSQSTKLDVYGYLSFEHPF